MRILTSSSAKIGVRAGCGTLGTEIRCRVRHESATREPAEIAMPGLTRS